MTNRPSSELFGPPPLLASTSPRRRELLARILPNFDIASPGIPENESADAAPGALCLLNARAKAFAVAAAHPGRLVIAADTVVHHAGCNLGKPVSLEEARRMLQSLSGATHWVFTAVCLAHKTGGCSSPPAILEEWVEQARVTFHPLSEAAIESVLARSNPLDKAGAYGLQDDDGTLVAAVEGEPETVIGLPLRRLKDSLTRHIPGQALMPSPAPSPSSCP